MQGQGRRIAWGTARRFILTAIAAAVGVGISLGAEFIEIQYHSFLVFVALMSVGLIPFTLGAELAISKKPPSLITTLLTYLQTHFAGIVLLKYIFSPSMNRQFFYNAAPIYAAVIGTLAVLLSIDHFVFERNRSRDDRPLESGMRRYISPVATVLALCALIVVGLHRKYSIIPKMKFAFLKSGEFFADTREVYSLGVLSSALSIEDPMQVIEVPGRSDALVVISRSGKIYALEGTPFTQRLILDVSSTLGEPSEELGMEGGAFAPLTGTSTTSRLFLWYAHEQSKDHFRDRLVSYEANLATLAIDTRSEQTLIDQKDPSPLHNGGGVGFGKDGYLYLALGDGGPVNDASNNSQVLDRDLFSGILRLDVLGSNPGKSKPISRQPKNGSTQGYRIPLDNPFVGRGVLEEYWAVGLRNPFRIDAGSTEGGVWVGDVGQAFYEEVSLIRAGENHQWSYREGLLTYSMSRFRGKRPTDAFGTDTKPLLAYAHQSGRGCVIGGSVYRGTDLPGLNEKYVFGDFLSGELFTVTQGAAPKFERIFKGKKGMTSISSLGGRLIMTYLGSGDKGGNIRVLRLGKAPANEVEVKSIRDTYTLYCSRCHGMKGTPTGAWEIPNVNPPRNFADGEWQARVTDADIAARIRKGGASPNTAMPAWEKVLSPAEVTEMVGLIRSFRAPIGDAGPSDAGP